MKKFGHYEVTAELGRGGMGVVYKGFEPSLNRKVAIKCLGEHLLTDKDLVERFTREAKATAAVNDPNVIQIYFIGKEGDQPYFAMEYIEGQSLDDILKGGNSLPVKNAKNILKQACKGMGAAHKLDLVHRDIKPANLMLTTEGILKVVDFGIARTREYGDKLTNTGEFVGTPGYLSPEVCVGKEVDERSDIFSLGIVFYEMLAGKVPFENDSPLGLMLEVVQSDIPDIRALNKKVDKKTAFILQKMIAKSPDDRYQNCDEIIRDLGNTIENESLVSIKNKAKKVTRKIQKVNVSDQITLPGNDVITAQNLTSLPKKSTSGGGKKWLLAATVFAVLGAGAFGYYNGYLPFPNKPGIDSNQSLALVTTNDTNNTNETSNTNQYPDIKTDSVNSVHSEVEGKGLIAGINSMFADDEQKDEVAVVDNTQIDFPADTIESATLQTASVETTNQEGAEFKIDVNETNNESMLASNENESSTIEGEAPSTADFKIDIQGNTIENLEQVENQQIVEVDAKSTKPLVESAKQLTQSTQADYQTIAHNTDVQSTVIAESKKTVPPVATDTVEKVATTAKTQVVEKIVYVTKPTPKPKNIPLNKGVVVIAFGDPAVANPIEKILETQLKQQGIKVMNEQFIPGMRQLMDNGLDLAELKNLIQKNGGQAMVIANVNYVGSQQLNYAGRSSELINAQLDIDTYDIKTGDSIGTGYGSKLSYTSLNATDEATEAVMQFTNELTSNLKNNI